jgi:hypothetical protein
VVLPDASFGDVQMLADMLNAGALRSASGGLKQTKNLSNQISLFLQGKETA